MKFKLQPYSIHELGHRENQEDSMFPDYQQSKPEDRLFILCDGMGGHEKGEVASATVCEAMSKTILSRWNPTEPLSDELLQQAIDDAFDALDAKDSGGEKKMGTTMTFVCFHADGITVAHIGDSRVYQFRPATKKEPARIVFKTRDHSLVNDLIDIGEITEEEAKTHPQKNVITRAMQPCQERRAKADIEHWNDVETGDYFYMCSDGMLEQTSDENLLNIITKSKTSNEQKVEMLRSVTDENKDNHTAHLIYINKVISKPATASNGTWITPENEKPKKKPLLMTSIIGIVVLTIIAFAGYYYFASSHDSVENKESVKTDTDKKSRKVHAQAHNSSSEATQNEKDSAHQESTSTSDSKNGISSEVQGNSNYSNPNKGTKSGIINKIIPKDKAKTATGVNVQDGEKGEMSQKANHSGKKIYKNL